MIKRTAKILGFTLLALVALIAVILGYGFVQGNFHEVYPQELYRSSQLLPSQLESRLREHQIRSVLNLRGEAPGEKWYEEERATAAANGAIHADFEMTASSALNQARMEALIATMERLPKPLLVHCWGGADRSGLAAALYAFRVKNATSQEAAKQLSAAYGHIPYLWWSKTAAMDRSFSLYIENAERSAGK